MLLSKETKVLNLELSLLLAGQIGSMFLMLALGVGLIRGKILRTQDATVISKILLYAVVPCAILKSYEIDYSPSLLAGLGLSILGAVIAHAVFLLFERLLRRPLHLRPVESASLIYSNAGNLIFPLVYAALGEQWVFYVSGYMMVQQLLIWTHGRNLVSGQRRLSFRKILTNVNILAIIAGLLVFITGFHFPGIVHDAIDAMAGMIGPLSMLLTGMLLGSMSFRKIVGNTRAYGIALLRLFIFPAAVILLFAVCGLARLHPDGGNILLVTVLACVSSAATTITQFAQLYDQEPGYASVISVLTVLLCIFSIPLMAGFYQWLL